MRFLSKRLVYLFFIVIGISAIVFLGVASQGKNKFFLNVGIEQCCDNKDSTIFNIHYENKIWTFYGKDFELKSNIFFENARINNYNRNGTRQDKIKLINKLIQINIEPEIAFNYIYLGFSDKIKLIQKNVEKSPKDAELSIIDNKINIKNEIIGIKLDKYLLYKNLINLYQNNNIINIEVPVIKTEPNITAEGLKKYTFKRAEFSTSISTSGAGRKYNVRKALNKINGTKLSTREKFSFNKCVGKRTVDAGYKNAKVILDGEFVDGIGGGVCQVSTTLYNAVLLSGLNVLSSQKHSQRVGYVKAGFDAMVNYGTSDLVFENNTNGEIYILCKYTDSKITISIYGESLNLTSFKLESEIDNYINPGSEQIIYDNDGKYIDKVVYCDESFELKKAREGYSVKSYLMKYENGKEVSKTLLRTDKYLPQQRVVVRGVKVREVNVDNVLNGITEDCESN